MAHQQEFTGMPVRRKIRPTFLKPGTDPDVETIRVSGDLVVKPFPELGDLYAEDHVIVTITGMDGQTLASAQCELTGGGMKVKKSDGLKLVVKAWTAVPE